MRKWWWRYCGAAGIAVAILLALVWWIGGFTDMGLSDDGTVALVLTTAFTALLAIGLMGLTFYSGRSGHDDKIAEAEEEVRKHRLMGGRKPGRH